MFLDSKIKKRKMKKIWILLAVCAVCIVAVTIYRSKKKSFEYGEPMESDAFVARYKYENIDEEGTLFPYYSPVELKMQVGLWYKEGKHGKEKPYMQISWTNEKGMWKEKVKKFYLDESYCRDGVYDEEQGDPELEPVSIRFFMNKNTIPEEGAFSVRFIVDTKPYEIWFDRQSPPEVMYLKYKKQEDGILVYTEKRTDISSENGMKETVSDIESTGTVTEMTGMCSGGGPLEVQAENDLRKWFYFEVYEMFLK